MPDKVEGFLEVGRDNHEVIINHADLKPDEKGVGHIKFSPNQARNLARLLIKHADELDPSGSLYLAEQQVIRDAKYYVRQIPEYRGPLRRSVRELEAIEKRLEKSRKAGLPGDTVQ